MVRRSERIRERDRKRRNAERRRDADLVRRRREAAQAAAVAAARANPRRRQRRMSDPGILRRISETQAGTSSRCGCAAVNNAMQRKLLTQSKNTDQSISQLNQFLAKAKKNGRKYCLVETERYWPSTKKSETARYKRVFENAAKKSVRLVMLAGDANTDEGGHFVAAAWRRHGRQRRCRHWLIDSVAQDGVPQYTPLDNDTLRQRRAGVRAIQEACTGHAGTPCTKIQYYAIRERDASLTPKRKRRKLR